MISRCHFFLHSRDTGQSIIQQDIVKDLLVLKDIEVALFVFFLSSTKIFLLLVLDYSLSFSKLTSDFLILDTIASLSS